MRLVSFLARAGSILTQWTQRSIPDSWVIAVILSMVVAILAMTLGGASPAAALTAWGSGLWALLSLAMQFTLMMVVAYSCAAAPPMRRAFSWLASRPDASKRTVSSELFVSRFVRVTAPL